MNATKRALAAAALVGVAVISATATAHADSPEAAPYPAAPYPGGYPGYPGYPGFIGAGPPVAPGSTQALYNNNAVASGTQGLLNKIAFGVL